MGVRRYYLKIAVRDNMGIFLLSLNVFEITDLTQKRGRERRCAARYGIIQRVTQIAPLWFQSTAKVRGFQFIYRTKVKMIQISRKKGDTHLT